MEYEKDKIYTVKKIAGFEPGISFSAKILCETNLCLQVEFCEDIKIPLYKPFLKGDIHEFDKRLFQVQDER